MRWAAFPRFLLAWALTLVMSLACSLLSFLIPPHRAWLLCGQRFARGVLWLLGLESRLLGASLPENPVLYIANHQSFLDPLVLMALLPASTKWVAKAEVRRIPLIGRAFSTGCLYIDRSDREGSVNTLKRASEGLPENWSAAIFPEGTRSPDGGLQPFRHGAALMAVHSHLPVVPLGISAAPGVLQRKVWATRPGRVEVVVGQTIETDAWKQAEIPERTGQLHAAVASLVHRGAGPFGKRDHA